MTMTLNQFHLPPIQDALIIGKRTSVGAHSICKSFREMSPGMFQLIEVEHPIVEAILVRKSDLRKLPEKELIGQLLHQSEQIMDQTDTIHVKITIEVTVEQRGIEV